MRAVTFSRLGGPEVLEVSELPEPTPGAGEVRIRVAAATVNPTDISFRSGRQFTVDQLAEMGVRPPFIPGMELAGVVDAVGEGATLRPGERVMAIVNPRRPSPRPTTFPSAGLSMVSPPRPPGSSDSLRPCG